MNAIYLMLIILAISWLTIIYFIIKESQQDNLSKYFFSCVATISVVALSFLVIIFGPSKIV